MFMNLEIKPKVGDLVRVNDPFFDDDTCGYCIESEEKFFTLRYFDDASRQYDFDYWYEEDYDLEMSIISSTQYSLMISESYNPQQNQAVANNPKKLNDSRHLQLNIYQLTG